jgi:hypothetical protein
MNQPESAVFSHLDSHPATGKIEMCEIDALHLRRPDFYVETAIATS